MWKKVTTFLVFITIFKSSVKCGNHLELDDICVLSKNGTTGICKRLNECPHAQKLLQTNKIKPKICGFQHITPIICCEKIDKPQIEVTTDSPYLPHKDGQENISKSDERCMEYANLVYKNQSSPVLLPGILWEIANTCEYDEKMSSSVTDKEFPHIVSIGYRTNPSSPIKYKCTGALISEEYILTTATCTNLTHYGLPKVVRLGTTILQENYFEYPEVQFIDVQEFIRHPRFNNSRVHDIALIKLSIKPILNSFTRPGCLTRRNVQPKSVIAVGYSSLYNEGNFQKMMNKTSLNINTNSEMNSLFSTDLTLERGRSVLDLGAPLVVYNQSPYCTYNIVSLLSYVEPHNRKMTGYLTNVSRYVEWIEENIWGHEF